MNPVLLIAQFDRLTETPEAVPRLRGFLLDLAARGRLVAQDRKDEPAAELLKHIESTQLLVLSDRELRKLGGLEPIDEAELPFPSPPGWKVTRLGWLAEKLGAGSTPLGGKSVYQDDGIPFLRSQNVYPEGLRLDDIARIPATIHEKMSGTHVQALDILLNITGASIGRCALVPPTLGEANVSQHVAIIRLFLPDIRDFIHLLLRSQAYQTLIDTVQVGVSRPGLSMQRLRQFPMFVPPMAEQRRIVEKVDELMALCDELEESLTTAQTQRSRLLEAVLHEALETVG